MRIRNGTGKILVNGRPFESYFPILTHQVIAKEPLRLTQTEEVYDVDATLDGGGVSGQAGRTMDELAAAGFKRVDPPANADNSKYKVTEVRYGPGGKHKAQLVAAYLGVGKLTGRKNARGADVTVVLGDDFDKVTTPSTEPPTTTTAVPTVTSGPVANPGNAPGAAP